MWFLSMASKQEPTLPLKLLVDKEKNRVVVAEASGDFVDVLFSFLTLPLGTIIRLLSKKQVEIGCIKNLYQSVENFKADEVFWNHFCKKMLLFPRNPCESPCKKLKLKVDDTEPTKYFMCKSNCKSDACGKPRLLSTFAEVSCSCGKLMDKEMKLQVDSSEESTHHGNGAFVKGETMYLIHDDLKVLHSFPGNSVQQLVQLGYRDFNKLIEMSPNVGLEEILNLLKQALTSKSPLSDVFLGNGESKPMHAFSPKLDPNSDPGYSYNSITNLKITVSKSKNKILYAEAEEDFVDFLFSFLTTPLGSILYLLDGMSSLGCMDILYKSLTALRSSRFTNSLCDRLLYPRVAPQFGCRKHPAQLSEGDTPSYWFGTGVIKNNICYVSANGVISETRSLLKDPEAMKLFEPRSPNGTKEYDVGFVRRPSVFVVWDDLQVTPFANTSSISFVQKLNVPLDDMVEHVVTIGKTEALNLLGASLTSKAALTEGLFYLLKKPKEEAKA